MFSLEAIALIAENLRACVHDGKNIVARERMLLGSLYAGIGLANAGVTAVHSLSYPLGGKYGVGHGLANTMLLPAVMAFNMPSSLEKFTDIAEAMGENVEGLPVREAAFLALDAVEALAEVGLECDLVVDGGEAKLGRASSVWKVEDGKIEVLREGPVKC
jgi:alcohol dehydrogenase